MIEIKCPRCEQYWYSDEDEGRVRLCSRCGDELRRQRRHRGEIDVPFLVAVALCLLLDLVLILLTTLRPAIFGKVMLGFGCVLFLAGGVFLRVLARTQGGIWRLTGDVDWSLGRWGLLALLTGLACLLAYGSFVGFAR
jgi:hypothetical protein